MLYYQKGVVMMKYFPKIVGEHVYLSPMNIEDADTYVKAAKRF